MTPCAIVSYSGGLPPGMCGIPGGAAPMRAIPGGAVPGVAAKRRENFECFLVYFPKKSSLFRGVPHPRSLIPGGAVPGGAQLVEDTMPLPPPLSYLHDLYPP